VDLLIALADEFRSFESAPGRTGMILRFGTFVLAVSGAGVATGFTYADEATAGAVYAVAADRP